jgi:large subunit ribosomal protein L25
MEVLTLQAAKRDMLGKKNRFLRQQGITPTHLFGHGIESQALQCDTLQLKQVLTYAGTTRLISLKIDGEKQPKSVFVREIQRDVVKKRLLHVDFYQVRKGEKIEVEVPIILVGEAPAMKTKGRMISHPITSLDIECLPDKVPPQIEIDISILEDVEQAIHVKDIVLDPDITVRADPEQLVVKVSEAMVQVEEVAEEAVEEEVAEAEVPAEGAAEQPPAESSSEKEE